MDMAPATIGGGRYQLEGLLGRGGMAEVRKARDLRLGRTVAIKRLRSHLAVDPTFQARFRREAQSAAALNHPSIVAVYDTGQEAAPDGSDLMLPYIVMEYVEGSTLRDLLRDGRKILPERALEITCSVLTALDYSHRAGIIHRDIKPANVMLTPTGDVKVMDFGIARAVADSSVTMTQTAAVIGTAQYLSPEQARGEQVDARSDIYSTGCLLYELLTGRPPFVGDSPVSVAIQHVREEPTPPSTLNPEISAEIDAITLKALAKSLDERYQSAVDMRTDVERALNGVEVLAPPVVGATELETEHFLAQPPLDPTFTLVNPALIPGDDEEDPKRRRTGLWAGALLALAALVIAGFIVVPQLIAGGPPAQVRVPRIIGLSVNAAQEKLSSAGLQLGQQRSGYSTSVKAGHILRQIQKPSSFVDSGSAVDVVVSAGNDTVVIPSNIARLSLAQATRRLDALHLNVVKRRDAASSEPRNQVTTTSPGPGVEVSVGSSVTVYYSTGYVTVPSVVGMSQAAARATLISHDLVPIISTVVSSAPAGLVTSQSLQAGTKQVRGTNVVISVSLGPSTSPPSSAPTTQPTTTPPTSTAPTTTAPTSTAPTTTTPTTTKPTTATTSPTSSTAPRG